MSAYFVLNRHCSPRLRLHISWFANVGKYCVGLCPTVNIGKIKDISINPLGNNRRQRRSKNIFRGITRCAEPIWGINSFSPFILSWYIAPAPASTSAKTSKYCATNENRPDRIFNFIPQNGQSIFILIFVLHFLVIIF